MYIRQIVYIDIQYFYTISKGYNADGVFQPAKKKDKALTKL